VTFDSVQLLSTPATYLHLYRALFTLTPPTSFTVAAVVPPSTSTPSLSADVLARPLLQCLKGKHRITLQPDSTPPCDSYCTSNCAPFRQRSFACLAHRLSSPLAPLHYSNLNLFHHLTPHHSCCLSTPRTRTTTPVGSPAQYTLTGRPLHPHCLLLATPHL
jgi:hypothetical protein